MEINSHLGVHSVQLSQVPRGTADSHPFLSSPAVCTGLKWTRISQVHALEGSRSHKWVSISVMAPPAALVIAPLPSLPALVCLVCP